MYKKKIGRPITEGQYIIQFHINRSLYSSMSITGIQGQLLEITVVGCNKLKDTEWISRQDPYVCLEYGSTKFRTRTCTDGNKNPTFQEKFVFTLIEGLREINVSVWNSNTLSSDVFIGGGKVQLLKVLSQGFDDTAWTLQTKTGRYAGEVRLILHYSNALKPATSFAPSAPPYVTKPMPQVPLYYNSTPTTAAPYAPPAYPAPSPYSSYPPNSAGYPPSLYSAPPPAAYPPPPYPPTSAYPPPPYPPPPQSSSYYPPPPQSSSYYPPPPQSSSYYPPGPYPGMYPPPPY
ncbi:leucine-rich repeat extensin-like protein 3 [Alnus glutinosa]|uniref:leucine-rich repeat extensin-like protein 3 n=1 Tax=Alnus glutinosa TaxID=3517 RepID=UPI002D769A74|nr:leucine-rich repeat extensin-like protein 3 [Alnus glutinosa]